MDVAIHTDSIKENIVVPKNLSVKASKVVYANEADVLNVALFGMTAKEWEKQNKSKKGNIRDYADVYQLVCLANLESMNSELIRAGMSQGERLLKLNEMAIRQMRSLQGNMGVRRI